MSEWGGGPEQSTVWGRMMLWGGRVPRSTGEQRGRAAEGGGPFKRGGDGTMAIITLALEVTPGPLRFHLGPGRGMARFLAGEGREGKGRGRRGGAARPGAACGRPLPRVSAGLAPGRRQVRAASCLLP